MVGRLNLYARDSPAITLANVCGRRRLAFALCRPTMPIFVGGAVRFIVEKLTGREESESEVSSGMLYSTGLVAGGSVAGVLIAGISMIEWDQHRQNLLTWIQDHSGHLADKQGRFADMIAVAAFCGLCYLLYKKARQRISGTAS